MSQPPHPGPPPGGPYPPPPGSGPARPGPPPYPGPQQPYPGPQQPYPGPPPGPPYPGQQPGAYPNQPGQRFPGQGVPTPPPGFGVPPPSWDPGHGAGPPGVRGRPPATVRTSAALWCVYVLLGVVNVILIFLSIDELVALGIAASGVDASAIPAGFVAQLREQVSAAVTTRGVGRLIGLALVLGLALRMRTGANWARITLTVLAIVVLVFTAAGLQDVLLLGDAGGVGTALLFLTFAELVVPLVALVLMYVRTAGWFRRR